MRIKDYLLTAVLRSVMGQRLAHRDTGYRGRQAIAEFLALDAAIERAAVSAGMVTMFDAGLDAAVVGTTIKNGGALDGSVFKPGVPTALFALGEARNDAELPPGDPLLRHMVEGHPYNRLSELLPGMATCHSPSLLVSSGVSGG